MEILDRFETAIDKLLEKNHNLECENSLLQNEKDEWQRERNYLLEEIDRILKRLDSVQLEEP
jgi:FtsZ-binding cell division protein ZapB